MPSVSPTLHKRGHHSIVQAMHNATTSNMPVSKKYFNYTMQTWEEKLNNKYTMMVSSINLITNRSMEATSDKNPHSSIQHPCTIWTNGSGIPNVKRKDAHSNSKPHRFAHSTSTKLIYAHHRSAAWLPQQTNNKLPTHHPSRPQHIPWIEHP